MEYGVWLMLCYSALALTIASFAIKNRRIDGTEEKIVLLPLLAGIFYLAAGSGFQQIHYLTGDGLNINIYDHEMGDWSGDYGVYYLLTYTGVILLVYSLYLAFVDNRKALSEIPGGNP